MPNSYNQAAKQYALKLLSYRGRSEKELEERLGRKGFTKSAAYSTIQYLKELGLIDDMALAETLKREALTTKLLSLSGARRYIINRGIPREVADMVFGSGEYTDIENAERFVEKKLNILRNYPPETARRRLYNLLLRRGYSSETITKVLRDKLDNSY